MEDRLSVKREEWKRVGLPTPRALNSHSLPNHLDVGSTNMEWPCLTPRDQAVVPGKSSWILYYRGWQWPGSSYGFTFATISPSWCPGTEEGIHTAGVWSNTLPAQGWSSLLWDGFFWLRDFVSWVWVLPLGLSSQRGCSNYKPVIWESSTQPHSCFPKSLLFCHCIISMPRVLVEGDRSGCSYTMKIWYAPWCHLRLLCVSLFAHPGFTTQFFSFRLQKRSLHLHRIIESLVLEGTHIPPCAEQCQTHPYGPWRMLPVTSFPITSYIEHKPHYLLFQSTERKVLYE